MEVPILWDDHFGGEVCWLDTRGEPARPSRLKPNTDSPIKVSNSYVNNIVSTRRNAQKNIMIQREEELSSETLGWCFRRKLQMKNA